MPWPEFFFRPRPRNSPKQETPPPDNQVETAGDPAPEPEFLPAESLHPLPVSQVVLPPAPVGADSTVARDMQEADTLRQMSRTGGVRLIKRNFSWPNEAQGVHESSSESVNAEAPQTPESETMPAPDFDPVSPELSPPTSIPAIDEKKMSASTSTGRGSPSINLSGNREAASASVFPSAMTIIRRRTKIADVARIILPPRREEAPAAPTKSAGPPSPVPPPANAIPASAESAGIVIPPAFPVALPTRVSPEAEQSAAIASEQTTLPLADETEKSSTPVSTPAADVTASMPSEETSVPSAPAKSEKEKFSPPPAMEIPPPSAGAEPSSPTTLTPADTREKREFVLSNGERILGHVLSESADSIYIDHSTLGVLTIPRAQIAQRPVEIILINGDRIVGDVIAETSDSLFVRHASLGILTVPRSQRSTRVVEAILKDGDRILGEVLGETENFTVIRSATLGTVAVPHNRVAMLNRRAEQIEMKALPAPQS